MNTKFESYNIWVSKKGYPCIWIDGKEIKLHVYVWERANGRRPKGFDIHHLDENKLNHNLSNLELLNHSDHRRIHSGWIREKGEWIKKPCNNCRKVLPLSQFYLVKTRNIQSNFCKLCHIKTTSSYQRNPSNLERTRATKRKWYHNHKK